MPSSTTAGLGSRGNLQRIAPGRRRAVLEQFGGGLGGRAAAAQRIPAHPEAGSPVRRAWGLRPGSMAARKPHARPGNPAAAVYRTGSGGRDPRPGAGDQLCRSRGPAGIRKRRVAHLARSMAPRPMESHPTRRIGTRQAGTHLIGPVPAVEWQAFRQGTGHDMKGRRDKLTWTHDQREVVTLSNTSKRNFILELPTGRCRLDAGRRMQTMASLLEQPAIRKLVDQGDLTVDR